MAYRMVQLTDTVRVGRMNDGALDIEVWNVKEGWLGADENAEMQEVFLPHDAVECLFEYLR